MDEYVVVLVWDTESDEGEVPVLFKVMADTGPEAIKYAIEKAHDGSLYCKIFNPESEVTDEEYMEINRTKSFALPMHRLAKI